MASPPLLMPRTKRLFLLIALLLKGASSLAQSQSAPVPAAPRAPEYEQVSVPVPRAVTLVADVARILLGRDVGPDKVQALIERRHARSEKREQSLTIRVPRNRLTRGLGLVE